MTTVEPPNKQAGAPHSLARSEWIETVMGDSHPCYRLDPLRGGIIHLGGKEDGWQHH